MYEVYICKLGDDTVYIGQGVKGRHKHCISGKSHVYELNEIFFSEKLKSSNFTCRDTIEKMEKLLLSDKELKSFVETIGIDAIKATGFHKTKCKSKFNKAVGVDEKSIKQLKVIKGVKLKVNSFYTFAELRDKLIIAYSAANLSCTAKATDIQQCYVAKKTARNKIQGFLIVDKV